MKLVAILALVLTIPAASAASLAYTPSGGLTTVCYGLTCGTTFQALQPMTVTGLATFGGNFFSYSNTPSPVTVGLWDDQGQLLASAEVNNLTSTLYDGIWYGENIAPVTLAKDANYVLGTFVPVANAAPSPPATPSGTARLSCRSTAWHRNLTSSASSRCTAQTPHSACPPPTSWAPTPLPTSCWATPPPNRSPSPAPTSSAAPRSWPSVSTAEPA